MTVADTAAAPQDWTWSPQPEAQAVVDELLAAFLRRCPRADTLATRMKDGAGTRFKDWVDSIYIPAKDTELIARIEAVGFERTDLAVSCSLQAVYRNTKGLFPEIVTHDDDKLNVALKIERVADFMARQGVEITTETTSGVPGDPVRWTQAFPGDHAELWGIERHGVDHFGEANTTDETRTKAAYHLERLRTRPRHIAPGQEEAGFASIHERLDAAIADLGRDWTCDLFFQAERDYWMSRNRAGRVQYARQNAMGLGWANHDHHTFRCSRAHYPKVIAVLEKLGFFLREKFYAGGEAGWGAQVLEQPVTKIVIFADVDMRPDEVTGDFPHDGFGPKDDYGTVGLWVALHGESMLNAGMHHLECQFDWHALTNQLDKEAGIGMMAPFTTFPFLRQAFTEGERWAVAPERLDKLVSEGHISSEQAAKMREHGAIGSHLENLERNDGFKGFNQHGVSDIISRTDARKH